MSERWTDLDPEIKTKIDGMSREQIEAHLREEDPSSELRQGVAGEYLEERYRGASGMDFDTFYREEALARAEEDGPDEEDDPEDEDDPEGDEEELEEEDGHNDPQQEDEERGLNP